MSEHLSRRADEVVVILSQIPWGHRLMQFSLDEGNTIRPDGSVKLGLVEYRLTTYDGVREVEWTAYMVDGRWTIGVSNAKRVFSNQRQKAVHNVSRGGRPAYNKRVKK